MLIVGSLYKITQRGHTLPNLYRFERVEPHHCQLHGDYIGQQLLFRKRRNSEKRPWGGLYVFSASDEYELVNITPFTVCSICGTPMERNDQGQLYCPVCDPSEGK